ncbi:MAG: hypothetical protein HOP08_14035 [Cyclobacteriaceae bacterium]|nr:hypothetical protein [Cyclobacteriaceae bacterium]
MKNVGIVLIVLGAIMMAITGFNLVTKKKVVDLGPVEINKEENHPVQWSPIVGGVLLVAGIVVVFTNKKS